MKWSILISTFERPKILARTLRLIRESWPDVSVTVGDQSRVKATDVCQKFDAQLQALPFDCGLSASRNRLSEQAKTKWVVLIDDDIKMYKEFCNPEFIFTGVDSWGFVAASVALRQEPIRRTRQWIGMMEIHDGYVVRVKGDRRCRIGGGWRSTEFLPPGVLFARATKLVENPFCERLKIAEGLEWCWRIKHKVGPLKLGMLLRQKVFHAQDPGGEEYRKLRRRGQEYYQRLGFEIMGVKGHGGNHHRGDME